MRGAIPQPPPPQYAFLAWAENLNILPFSAYGNNIQFDCAVLRNEFCRVVMMAAREVN